MSAEPLRPCFLLGAAQLVSHSLSGTVVQERLGSAETRICDIQLLSDFLSLCLPGFLFRLFCPFPSCLSP